MPFAGRHVVLGVSGGIACYKSCIVARRLTEEHIEKAVERLINLHLTLVEP